MNTLELIKSTYDNGVIKYNNSYLSIIEQENKRNESELNYVLNNHIVSTIKYNNINSLFITPSEIKVLDLKKQLIDGKNKHIIKTNKDLTKRHQPSYIHDYFVSSIITNNIKNIPNFSLTLGLIKNEEEMVLVYDNIKGVTLKNIIKSFSETHFLQVFSQIILALCVVGEKCEFVHNNLIIDNIYVNKLPYYITIPYTVNNNVIYVKTKYIITITNFNRSRIIYNGNIYGVDDYRLNIDRLVNYPHLDIFRILMDCFIYTSIPETSINSIIDQDLLHLIPNISIYNILTKLIKYYFPNVKDYIIFALESNKKYNVLPFSSEYNKPIYEFFKVFYNNNINMIGDYVSYYSNNDVIIYGSNFYDHKIDYKNPYIFLELCINNNHVNIIDEFKEYSKYYKRTLLKNIEKYLKMAKNNNCGNNVIRLTNSAPENIKFTKEFIKLYINYLNDLIKMSNIIIILYNEIKIYESINNIYPGEYNDELVKNVYKYINELYNDKLVIYLNQDINYYNSKNITIKEIDDLYYLLNYSIFKLV